ncbi:hypothetical protein QVD17_30418 [Tagetes erecta]|uniref:Uncharacterized protein n=1 Tax=Tagetes erecta TaxID=13708 RepID=A0AAD8K1I0_TARER|nr:hypothetical protein QVD17_30418 [Tagetes erecta]
MSVLILVTCTCEFFLPGFLNLLKELTTVAFENWTILFIFDAHYTNAYNHAVSYMPHLRSHRPVKHTFEEVDSKLETVDDSSAEVKVSALKFDFTPRPSLHNTPPSSPRFPM